MINRDQSIAIIGGGLAGLTCAQRLNSKGFSVEVFEKARAVGGRMSTRRRDGYQFDLGAQHFEATNPDFRSFIQTFIDAETVDTWCPETVSYDVDSLGDFETDDDLMIGVPGMDAICRVLGDTLDLHLSTRVLEIMSSSNHDGWMLKGTTYGIEQPQIFGPYQKVILAVPPPQAAPLLTMAPDFATQVKSTEMRPTWTLLICFNEAPKVAFDRLITTGEGPLASLNREASKKGRPRENNNWVAHAHHDWSKQNVDAAPGWVEKTMVAHICDILSTSPNEVIHTDLHRWLYSKASQPLGHPFLWDNKLGIGVCGDWCLGDDVGAAFLSGEKLGRHIIGEAVT